MGIRLNPKLANLPPMRNGLSSQSNVASKRGMRGAQSGRESNDHLYDRTTAASNPMTKSGFTYYPGQPLQVSQDSVLGQTLNKFELGVQDKSKLKQISGVEYYKQHIHYQQQRRLKKYIKDAAGQNPKAKRFIPLTDVAKPSMKGRVKMYMQKLTEEETKEKNRQIR